MQILDNLPCPKCDGYSNREIFDGQGLVCCDFCGNSGHVDVPKMMNWLHSEERKHEEALEIIQAQKKKLIEAVALGADI